MTCTHQEDIPDHRPEFLGMIAAGAPWCKQCTNTLVDACDYAVSSLNPKELVDLLHTAICCAHGLHVLFARLSLRSGGDEPLAVAFETASQSPLDATIAIYSLSDTEIPPHRLGGESRRPHQN